MRVSDRIGNLYSPQTSQFVLDTKSMGIAWLPGVPDWYLSSVPDSGGVLTETSFLVEFLQSDSEMSRLPAVPRSEWRVNSTHWSLLEASAGTPPRSVRDGASSVASPRLDSNSFSVVSGSGGYHPLYPRSTLTSAGDTSSFAVSPNREASSAVSDLSEARYWFYISSGVDLCESVTSGSRAVDVEPVTGEGTAIPTMREEWMVRVTKMLPSAPTDPAALATANQILQTGLKTV